MRYVQRDGAVERAGVTREGAHDGQGPEIEGPIGLGVSPTRGRDDGSWNRERDPAAEARSVAGAAQGYVVDPAKVRPVRLRNGEMISSSFGMIGDTLDEQVAFWEELERHDRKNARIQNRIIIELPHEATPEARLAMTKAFCARLREMGLPYHAAIHEPGPKNDSRNYHAHVLFSERPAKRMVDPADGMLKWDFSIRIAHTTSSRHTRYTNPHRQHRHPDMRKRTAVADLRRHAAEVVNAELAKNPVKDVNGKAVRYDPRSYKDMGLAVTPAKSISRIVADKVKGGRLTVLDGDYTRKMIEAEMVHAAERRQKDVVALLALDATLRELAEKPSMAQALNSRLPPGMRVSTSAALAGKTVKAIAHLVIKARFDALSVDIMERSSLASLQRVVEATDPALLEASRANTRDPARRALLPDSDAAWALREAALDEMAETKRLAKHDRLRASARLDAALNRWQFMARTDEPQPGLLSTPLGFEAALARAAARVSATPPGITGGKAVPERQPARETTGQRTQGERRGPEVAPPTGVPGADGPRARATPAAMQRSKEMMAGIKRELAVLPLAERVAALERLSEQVTGPRMKARLEAQDATVTPDLRRTQDATAVEAPAKERQSTSGERSDANQARKPAAGSTPEPQRDVAPLGQGTVPPAASALHDQAPAPDDAAEKATKRRKKRKAVLGRRNRRGGGWER